jgi:toxin ParE1/3/4
MFQIILDPSAELDVDEIFKWYEKQRQGLGFEFLISFDNSIQSLTRNPFTNFNVTKAIRPIAITKFPYNAYYSIKEAEGTVYVHVVMHQHKDPEE